MSAAQRSSVLAKYDYIYREIADAVESLVRRDGKPEAIFRALWQIVPRVWEVTNWVNAQPERPRDAVILERLQTCLDVPMSWRERGVLKSGTRGDWAESQVALFSNEVIAHVPRECDLFIDLGCGWGGRMISLYLAGLRPEFMGGDRSIHSRRAALAAASLFPALRLGWFQFDFLEPDFSALPDARRICVFSSHAIEQVRLLGNGVFDRLFERFPQAEVTGIHLEPIAFQIDPRRESDRAYAVANKYNTDLWSTLNEHRAIEVVHADAAILDPGTGNATSSIVWKRR